MNKYKNCNNFQFIPIPRRPSLSLKRVIELKTTSISSLNEVIFKLRDKILSRPTLNVNPFLNSHIVIFSSFVHNKYMYVYNVHLSRVNEFSRLEHKNKCKKFHHARLPYYHVDSDICFIYDMRSFYYSFGQHILRLYSTNVMLLTNSKSVQLRASRKKNDYK